MVAVLYSISWIIAAWLWGDWSKRREYYPTALFGVIGSLTYELICYEYQLWSMQPNGLPNSMIPILLLGFIGMPLSIFLYLSHYPYKGSINKQAFYIFIFVAIFVVLEYVSVIFGAITYHNGWNLYWSAFFDVVMFIILRLHYQYPRVALVLSGFFIFMLTVVFDLTLDKMK